MLNQRRLAAIEAVLRAVRTGENSAAEEAAATFAPSIVLSSNGKDVSGLDAVTDRLNGQWPLTPVYLKGEWSDLEPSAGGARISATFPVHGTIKGYALAFTFDGNDRLT